MSFYFQFPSILIYFRLAAGTRYSHTLTHIVDASSTFQGFFHLLFQLRKFDDRHALLLHLWTLTQTLLVDVN